MSEVGGVGGGKIPPQNQTNAGEVGQPVGQPGPLGQPTGQPVPGVTPQTTILPDVLAGRDASQLQAAEQMRARGGASATEELLGLNRQPTMLGALTAPPGNSEALRHMTPTMRRTVMRGLLDKQRASLRRLAPLLRRDRDSEEQQRDDQSSREEDEAAFAAGALSPYDETQLQRARLELGSAARMLDLLDELLAMQDYAVSQMGTFSQG